MKASTGAESGVCAPKVFLFIALVGASASAAGSTFQENLAAYRAATKPVDSAPFNSNFVANLAASQAKVMAGKGVGGTGRSSGGNLTEVVRAGAVDANGVALNDGGLNIASPVISGTVRGNVTVVVQRGAIKGNITAVTPK